MRQWRLMYASPTSGARNMAVDTLLLRYGQPTLRLYAWEPYCFSLGYGQRASDVDQNRLEALGWSLVRRPSGGRAILHAEELTYSLVLPQTHPLVQGSVVESYQRISRALLLALGQLGAAVTVAPGDGQRERGPVCFEQTSHYEICVNGRKLVGSAQLRRYGAVLQHGSIPLVGDVAQICDVLHYADESQRAQARKQVRSAAITLSEALGRAVAWDEVALAVVAGFRDCFELDFVAADIDARDSAEVDRLCQEVYANPEWTLRR